MMNTHRVVITGIGAFSASGIGFNKIWNDLLNGKSLISKISSFDCSSCRSHIASYVDFNENFLKELDLITPLSERRRLDKFSIFALVAALESWNDANLNDLSQDKKEFVGNFVTSGMGGVQTIEEACKKIFENKIDKISPTAMPALLLNLAAGNISIKLGLKGAIISPVSACASSAHSIELAFNYIKSGRSKISLAGGSEASVTELGLGAFDAMRALSSNFNNEPQKASRPFDKDRDGFVIAEGASILVLEEYEHAKSRNAKIYAEIIGIGSTCDSNHITAPDPNGNGGTRAMSLALKEGGILASDLDYINAHGTSTPLGDKAELTGISNLFQNKSDMKKLIISSTKSNTGHLLGATGAIEVAFVCKSISDGIIPKQLNLDNPIEEAENFTLARQNIKKDIKYAISNSFGFGGANCSILLKNINI